MIKHLPKPTQGKRRFIWLRLPQPSIIEGSQAKLKQRPSISNKRTKKYPTYISTGQSNQSNSSMKDPSSQVCQVNIKINQEK